MWLAPFGKTGIEMLLEVRDEQHGRDSHAPSRNVRLPRRTRRRRRLGRINLITNWKLRSAFPAT
jgi:hypothetical protein